MRNRLFVGGLAWATGERELRAAFEQFGQVTEASVILDHEGKSRGFGFIAFSTEQEADAARQAMDGQSLSGRRINVREAQERSGGPGGPGGGPPRGPRPPRPDGGPPRGPGGPETFRRGPPREGGPPRGNFDGGPPRGNFDGGPPRGNFDGGAPRGPREGGGYGDDRRGGGGYGGPGGGGGGGYGGGGYGGGGGGGGYGGRPGPGPRGFGGPSWTAPAPPEEDWGAKDGSSRRRDRHSKKDKGRHDSEWDDDY